jgi:hypothetical protein
VTEAKAQVSEKRTRKTKGKRDVPTSGMNAATLAPIARFPNRLETIMAVVRVMLRW